MVENGDWKKNMTGGWKWYRWNEWEKWALIRADEPGRSSWCKLLWIRTEHNRFMYTQMKKDPIHEAHLSNVHGWAKLMVDRRLLIPFFFRSFRSSPFFPLSSVISHRSRRLAAPPSHTGHALFFFSACHSQPYKARDPWVDFTHIFSSHAHPFPGFDIFSLNACRCSRN